MDTLTERQGESVVVHVQLILSGDSIVDSLDSGVLLVQPRSLHVGLLLGVVVLSVDLANKVGDCLDADLIVWSNLASSKCFVLLVEVINSLFCWSGCDLPKVVSGFSLEVSGSFLISMFNDNGSEP